MGSALIEFSFFFYVFCQSRQARRHVAEQLKSLPTESLLIDKRIVETLTTHVAAITLCLSAVLSFSVMVGIRNSGQGAIFCEQPACTSSEYPSKFIWALYYHICVWVVVLAIVPNRIATRIEAFLAMFVPNADDVGFLQFLPKFALGTSSSSRSVKDKEFRSINDLTDFPGEDNMSDKSEAASPPAAEDREVSNTPRSKARRFLLDEEAKVDLPRRNDISPEVQYIRSECLVA